MRSKKTGKRLKRKHAAVLSAPPVTVMVFDIPKYPASKTEKAARLVRQMRSIYAGLRYHSVSDMPHICESIARANELGVDAGAIFGEELNSEAERILSIAVFFARRIGQLYWSTLDDVETSNIQSFLDLRVAFCNATLEMLDEGQGPQARDLIVRAEALSSLDIKTTLIGAQWVEEPEDPDDYPSLVRPRLQRLIAKRGEWYVPIEVGGYGLVDAYEHPTLKDLSLFKLLAL